MEWVVSRMMGNMLWVWLPLVLLLVGVGLVIYAIVKLSSTSTPSQHQRLAPSAEELVRERYARGEISEEQLREQLRVLRDV